ncbi:transcriptional regulator, partial [Candidatus Aerophobetes bacterium]
MNKQRIRELDPDKQKIKMLDGIINFSFDGLWISDGEGKVLRVNKASEKMNGIKASEVVGKNVRDLIKEGFFDKSVTLEVLEKKTSVTILQKVKNGKTILVTGNPIFDDEGNIELVVVNERDITYLNEIRDKLKESQSLTKKYQCELSKIHLKNLEKDNIIFKSEAMEKVMQTALRVC